MLILEADGGCCPNPGEGTIGVVCKKNGKVLYQISRSIGCATNNIAEWQAALAALDYAIGYTLCGPEPVELRMDSQLVVNQLTGRWRTKNAGLKPLQEQGRQLLAALKEQGVHVYVRWVPREQNREADALTGEWNRWRQFITPSKRC